jgi:hypothetical protein
MRVDPVQGRGQEPLPEILILSAEESSRIGQSTSGTATSVQHVSWFELGNKNVIHARVRAVELPSPKIDRTREIPGDDFIS